MVKKIQQCSSDAKMPTLNPVEFDEGNELKALVAIDGSYTFLFCISNIWLGVVRACAVRYQFEAGHYKLRGVHLKEEPILISRNEALMKENPVLYNIYSSSQPNNDEFETKMINSYRMCLEELLGCEIAKEEKNCIIAMDGALYDRGFGALKELAELCSRSSNILLGISKDSTTHMFGSLKTDEELLKDLKAERAFVKAKKQFGIVGDTYFAKLHPNSKKWFRVDLCADEEPKLVFSALSNYSKSELCLGYPYPLLEAHRLVVVIRHFQELYEHEVLSAAMEFGIPVSNALEYMTRWEGERKGAFHEYLDKVARAMK